MIKSVRAGKEVSVMTPNKIGILSGIADLMANSGINLTAVAGYARENGKDAEIMLVADETATILDVLKKNKYAAVKEREVIIVELENKVGALKVLAKKLADNQVDIKSIYGTACSCAGPCACRIVIVTNNNQKALVALK
ncbi:MAG: hypothetical protein PHS37_06430 [Candidatus Omnitrophica bacterium]|nr:hypothetical protein [Candidatus Omnitrophota bacterium]